uniref:Uncharacterized protein n=1 Tax=Panagrolaimus superbus TaxID=310955 RepID=A0A914YG49_9BILA
MLPSGLSFDENKNVQIDILNSVKEIPYFFRIGLNRKYPRLNFTFDSQCIKTKFEFELYINGLDSEECKIDIRIIENGFNVSTNNANWTKIFDPDFSPTLAFDANQVFFKLETISIRPFDTCEFNNTLEIPKDQFVLQFNPKKVSEDCVKAVVIIPKIDVPNGIKVLIDPLKVNQNSLPPPDIYSTSTMLMPTDNSTVLLPKDNSDELISIPSNNSTATSLIPWWWFLIAVM